MRHRFRMFYGNSNINIPIDIRNNTFDSDSVHDLDPYIEDKISEMLHSKQVVSCCVELANCSTFPVKIYSHSGIRAVLTSESINDSLYELISDYLYNTIDYKYYYNVGKIINRVTKEKCSAEEIRENIPKLDESFEFCKYVKLRVGNKYHKFVEDNSVISIISDRGGD